MSVTSAPARAATPTDPTGGAPSIGRLIGLELRKSVDTRAGRWLLISIAAICVLIVLGVSFLGPDLNRTALGFAGLQQFAVALLLPVVGILAVTSEWSQRSTMTTYALVPARHRVTLAKVVAVIILSVVVTALTVALAFAATALAATLDRGGDYDLDAGFAARVFLVGALNVLVGVGFGMALLNSPLAIVLFFVLPTAFTIGTSFISWFAENGVWIDFTLAVGAMFEADVSGEDWAHLATSFALWGLLPLAIGIVRVSRREVS